MAYQRERFPLLAHGLLIAAFSGSAVCFSALLRHRPGLPDTRSFVAAFVTSLLFFRSSASPTSSRMPRTMRDGGRIVRSRVAWCR